MGKGGEFVEEVHAVFMKIGRGSIHCQSVGKVEFNS
jgi:hypothetical protein